MEKNDLSFYLFVYIYQGKYTLSIPKHNIFTILIWQKTDVSFFLRNRNAFLYLLILMGVYSSHGFL